jgi:hypothetical protein
MTVQEMSLLLGHFSTSTTATSQTQRGSIRLWLLSQKTARLLMSPLGEHFVAQMATGRLISFSPRASLTAVSS